MFEKKASLSTLIFCIYTLVGRSIIEPAMDSTPYDFRKRVAALWKCCDDGMHNSRCADSTVPDCEWTRKAEKKRICFLLGCDNGIWKYAFVDPAEHDKLWTLEQMLAHPNLKNVTIETIVVHTKLPGYFSSIYDRSTLLDVDMERVMKFAVYLSNEPYLLLRSTTAEDFSTREGSRLMKCLSEIHFSRIDIEQLFPVYNQFLRNQFSSRIPTQFVLYDSGYDRKFFRKHLRNGNFKRFYKRKRALTVSPLK